MTTRMYFWHTQGSTGLPTVAPHSTWESQVSNFTVQPIRKTPTTTSVDGLYTFNVSETDVAIHDQLCGQFISLPMYPQQISGTLTGIWMTRMAGATYGIGTQLAIRVVSYDGTVVRGTPYDPHNYGSTNTTAGAVGRRFATTTHGSRFLPGGTGVLNSVYAYHGDRLVVEIGARATNTTATLRTADPRIQTQTTFTDGTLTEDLTGANFNTWIEFSGDIDFHGSFKGTLKKTGWGVPLA